MRLQRFPVPFAVLLFSFVIAAPVSRAQTSGSGTMVNSFITALNNSDLTTASGLIAPSFTITFADGTSASGTDALSQIVTPITVVSVTPAGNHQVNAVLQFGSDVPMNVGFTGAGGMITAMSILGPAS